MIYQQRLTAAILVGFSAIVQYCSNAINIHVHVHVRQDLEYYNIYIHHAVEELALYVQ